MSTAEPMSIAAAGPAGLRRRAALVLLATLFMHAWLIDRVQRAEIDWRDESAAASKVISARLLAPTPPAVVSVTAPVVAPKPRPVRRAPVAAPREVSPEVSREVPSAIEPPSSSVSPPVSTPVEQAAAEPVAAPPVDESAPERAEPRNAERPAEPLAEVDAREFEAAGAALTELMDGVPMRGDALPAAMRYTYRTTYSELTIASGTTTLDWRLEGGRYQVRLATSALGIAVLALESGGEVRAFGLAPERYTETRTRRAATAASFDWEGRRVTFSARTHERALRDGVQDQLSFQFQLMLLGQAAPQRFRRGAETVMHVAGRDDLTPYRFRSTGRDRTNTGIGELDTVRVERLPHREGEARIEVWLAPDLAWLPVRLRFTDRRGRITESLLEAMGAP